MIETAAIGALYRSGKLNTKVHIVVPFAIFIAVLGLAIYLNSQVDLQNYVAQTHELYSPQRAMLEALQHGAQVPGIQNASKLRDIHSMMGGTLNT